jgi:hypothetical protein
MPNLKYMLQIMKATPQLVQALDRAYQALRSRHPDLPDMLLTVEVPHPAVSRRLAYATREQITTVTASYDGRITFLLPPEHRGHLPCVFDQGAVATFEVLVHEAAHALAAARGIKDTSRGGTYHNRHFWELAAELGLKVRDGIAGCENTTAQATLLARYRRHIDALADALPCVGTVDAAAKTAALTGP